MFADRHPSALSWLSTMIRVKDNTALLHSMSEREENISRFTYLCTGLYEGPRSEPGGRSNRESLMEEVSTFLTHVFSLSLSRSTLWNLSVGERKLEN